MILMRTPIPSSLILLFFLVSLTTQCNNYGLLDKLQNPDSTSSSAAKETYTSNYYVFVSSWTTLGAMNGSPYNSECSSSVGDGKADCACTRAAASRGLRRNSTHVFRAWLSTAGTNAKCRIQGLPNGTCDPGILVPWYNTNGQAVVTSYAGFAAGTLTTGVPVRFDEFGMDQGVTQVWTGTSATGTYSGTNCADWIDQSNTPSGTYGDRTATAAAWTTSTSFTCDNNARIYCVAAP